MWLMWVSRLIKDKDKDKDNPLLIPIGEIRVLQQLK